MNSEVANQATFLNAQGFNNVQANRYWSSSSYAGSAARAWMVGMAGDSLLTNDKAVNGYVWPVRAGQLHQHPQQGSLHRAGEHLRILAVRARAGSEFIGQWIG